MLIRGCPALALWASSSASGAALTRTGNLPSQRGSHAWVGTAPHLLAEERRFAGAGLVQGT